MIQLLLLVYLIYALKIESIFGIGYHSDAIDAIILTFDYESDFDNNG